jgi:hypothetical protein
MTGDRLEREQSSSVPRNRSSTHSCWWGFRRDPCLLAASKATYPMAALTAFIIFFFSHQSATGRAGAACDRLGTSTLRTEPEPNATPPAPQVTALQAAEQILHTQATTANCHDKRSCTRGVRASSDSECALLRVQDRMPGFIHTGPRHRR